MPITAPNHHLSKNFPDSDFLFGNYQRALLVTVAVLRAGRSGEPVCTVSPVEIEDPLSNPGMGWGLRVGPRYFDGRQFTLAYDTSGFGDDALLFSWMMEGKWRFSGARLRRGGLGYRLTLTRVSWRESILAGSLFLLK